LGAAAKSILSGSGTDAITLNGNRIHTVDSGAGVDTLTITSTAATSTINAGAGNDAITVTDVDQYVVLGGDGDDNVNVGVNAGATIMGGAGSDTLTVTAGTITLAAGFLTNSVEKLNINATNGTTAFTSAQFAGLTESEITGNTTSDLVQITVAAAGGTLDYSGVTKSTGSAQTVNIVLGAGADTVTGTSAFGETFVMNDLKGVDSIAGGAGTGNIDAISSSDTTYKEVSTSNTSSGIIVNLGDAAVTGVNILSSAASHLADGVTTVAGGTITQLYAAADTTKVNSNVVDTVSGIEDFTSTDAAGIEYVVGTSGNNVISVGAGNDYVDGGAGNDTITGGAGDDKTNGGDGDDTFKVTNGTEADDDIIDGGLGSDTVTVANGLTLTFSGDTDLKNVETLTFESAGVIKITTQTEGFTVTDGSTADKDAVLHGGTGDDTFTSSNALDSDTILMLAPATNGNDTYTGFTVGANLDKIDFTAATATGYIEIASAAVTLDTSAKGMVIADYNVTGASNAMTAAAVYGAVSAAGNTGGNANETAYVLVSTNATTAADAFVYFAKMNAASTTFASADLVLTMTGLTDLTAFDTTNFDVA
jgi:Ca2+-binding RTX toxin-like protein